jgi:putative membrane protein
MMSTILKNEAQIAKFRKLIVVVSIVIPIAVAALFGIKVEGIDLSFLPPFYAGINGVTAVLLITALVAIKSKNTILHQRLMQVCLSLSLLFLLCYVAYHMTSDSTSYGGSMKAVYYTILISHIILSVAVIPLVLFTYLFAWEGKFEKHKKWTRFAFPIWLYVAITGVVVYWMISPFYT